MTAQHFSRTIVRQLAQQGITLSGGQATPAFDGDKYFTGIAYGLVKNEAYFLRPYREVVAIAEGRQALELD